MLCWLLILWYIMLCTGLVMDLGPWRILPTLVQSLFKTCLFGMGRLLGLQYLLLAAFSKSRSSKLLDTRAVHVLSNTPAKCKVHRMNGCLVNPRTDIQTETSSILVRWSNRWLDIYRFCDQMHRLHMHTYIINADTMYYVEMFFFVTVYVNFSAVF